MLADQGASGVFKDTPVESGLDLRLARIENKLDRLLALLEGREEEGRMSGSGQGVFEGIYDNIKYPVAFLLDSVASLRGQTAESGAFTRL